jgi:hypothetical protein
MSQIKQNRRQYRLRKFYVVGDYIRSRNVSPLLDIRFFSTFSYTNGGNCATNGSDIASAPTKPTRLADISNLAGELADNRSGISFTPRTTEATRPGYPGRARSRASDIIRAGMEKYRGLHIARATKAISGVSPGLPKRRPISGTARAVRTGPAKSTPTRRPLKRGDVMLFIPQISDG